MKTRAAAAIVLALALLPGRAATDRRPTYLGSIAEIIPPAEWRAKPGDKPVALDPRRDLHRPLYSGNEIRCGQGGKVVVGLLLNRTNTIHATEWTGIPDHRADFERWQMEQWQTANTVTAGRTRGASPGRRALLVGINTYEVDKVKSASLRPPAAKSPPAGKKPKAGRSGWGNLDGCLNDVEEMRAILLARFGFAARDILLLTNSEASRAGILDGIRRQLIEPSGKGDVAFFFYAGHGSQVANSRSEEEDKLDESIVPADSALGTPDIRDKELRRLFNAVAASGASLTAIFDSCHSGSIARGFRTGVKRRSLEPDLRDIADDSDAGPFPSSMGALVISAALPTQEADEGRDAHNLPHGAFSLTFFDALRGLDPHESVERIFLRTKAGLQTWGRPQEPVFDGGTERLKRNLFGDPSSSTPDRTTVAILKINSTTSIILQGGLAVGLNPGCELASTPRADGRDSVRLRVTRVEGMALARAELIEGSSANLKAGDLFELSKWAAPDAPILRVSIPPALADEAAWRGLARTIEGLRRADRCVWVDDPTETSPSHVLFWNGTGWALQTAGGKAQPLSAALDAKSVLNALPNDGTKRAQLFVNLPPSPALRQAIALGEGTANNAIAVSESPDGARYLLLGRLRDGSPEYAWVAPNLSAADSENSAMSTRTDWFAVGAALQSAAKTGESLTAVVRRLGRIKAWLDFPAPADDGRFPYHLVLTNIATRELKTGGQQVKGGEQYGLRLRADPARVKAGVAPRYVYVFIMDKDGRSNLLFPATGGNDENRVPFERNPDGSSPADFALRMPVPLDVTEPFGVDTYILLTSDQPLPNPRVLESDGVRTRGTESTDTLSKLLGDWGGGTRGGSTAVPKDWSIERLTLRSAKPGQ